MPGRVRRTTLAAALTVAVAVGIGGCNGDDSGDPSASADGSGDQPTAPAIETRLSYGEVTGRLDRATRQRLLREVGEVVDGWTQAAYLGGDYPRTSFDDSWPGFTRGAQERAEADRALMSNQDIGDRIDGVTPRRSVVAIDVLATRGTPNAVTARVQLGFRTSGDLERTVRVRGRLFLVRTDGRWQVIGYDMTKGATA